MLVAALGALLTLIACAGRLGNGPHELRGAPEDVQEQITKRRTSPRCATRRRSARSVHRRLEAEFAKIGGGRCSAAVDRAIRNADYTRIVVDSVTLNGDDKTATRAEARTIAETDGPKRGITLVRSDAKSAWRIDGFQAKGVGHDAGRDARRHHPEDHALAPPPGLTGIDREVAHGHPLHAPELAHARAQLERVRRMSSVTDWVSDAVETGGYPALAGLILLENLFPPIPSEIILPLAGFSVGKGGARLPPAVVGSTLGSVVGALILYVVARRGGRRSSTASHRACGSPRGSSIAPTRGSTGTAHGSCCSAG